MPTREPELTPEDCRVLVALYELEFSPYAGGRHSPVPINPISPVPLYLIVAATLPIGPYSRMPQTLARLTYLDRLGYVRRGAARRPSGGFLGMRDGRFVYTSWKIGPDEREYTVYIGSSDELNRARTRRAAEIAGDRGNADGATPANAWNQAYYEVLPEFERFSFFCRSEREVPGGHRIPARVSEYCIPFALTQPGTIVAHDLFNNAESTEHQADAPAAAPGSEVEPAEAAENATPTAQADTDDGILVGVLRDRIRVSTTTLRRYARAAGVKTPARGQHNFRYSNADAIAILRRFTEHAQDQKLRETCNAELVKIENKLTK